MSAKKAFFKYSEENLRCALKAVRSNELKIREAARQFGVPYSTLSNKFNQKTPMERRMGPSPLISKTQEDLLENFLLISSKQGFPLSKRRIMLLAEEIAQREMGMKWFKLFMKRHPMVSMKYAETKSVEQSEESINWHCNLRKYVEVEYGEENLRIFCDPSRILLSDESGFLTDPNTGVILGPKGNKNKYEFAVGSEKEELTVLLTICADGEVFPPLVVLPYVRVPTKVAEKYNSQWSLGNSKSGKIMSDVYLRFIENSLLPELKRKCVEFPVLCLVDGHKSHISYKVAKFCNENCIILYSFRLNTSQIVQPADDPVFRSLKHNWYEEVKNFKSENEYQPVTKGFFGPLLEKALSKVTKETVSNSFKICGIFPFVSDNTHSAKLVRSVGRSGKDREVRLEPVQFGFEQLSYLESSMKHGRPQQFRKTYAEGSHWKGDRTAVELYEVWLKLRKLLPDDSDEELEEKIGTEEEFEEVAHRPPQETVLTDDIKVEEVNVEELKYTIESYSDEPMTS